MGWALWEGPLLQDSGLLKIGEKERASKEILTLIKDMKPCGLVYEMPPGGGPVLSVRTISILHHVCGCIETAAHCNNVYIGTVSNKTITNMMQTYGYLPDKSIPRAKRKKKTLDMIREVLRLDKKMRHDEADAIAIGMALWLDGLIFEILPEVFLTNRKEAKKNGKTE